MEHSVNMASGSTAFGHDGFSDRVSGLGGACAENVAMTPGASDDEVANSAVELWKGSPGHRANMLGAYTRAAVSAAKNDQGYWYLTQILCS